MSHAPDDDTATYRSEALRFMSELRRDILGTSLHGAASVPWLVERAVRDAGRAGDAWPTPEQRRHFLIELAAEARSEWTVQADPDGPTAQFYNTLKQRLSEMSRA